MHAILQGWASGTVSLIPMYYTPERQLHGDGGRAYANDDSLHHAF